MNAKRRELPTSNKPPPANSNRLLAALPANEYQRIMPMLDVIPLKLKAFLHKPGEAVQHVYFPGGGFCSIVTVLKDGAMVEVATIGREGMLGVEASDGSPPSSATMVQGESDTCYRMTADVYRHEMDQRGAFYELIRRYGQALMGFIMQSTACNAVHLVEQRLARWLLMARDRMGTDDFPLTQEFVAMMLGASRPTVSTVAGTLQKAGLITYRHGHLKILDRDRLEATSCECYQTTTNLLSSVTDGHRSRPR
jgi:CRP-like cAMP-binding protein